MNIAAVVASCSLSHRSAAAAVDQAKSEQLPYYTRKKARHCTQIDTFPETSSIAGIQAAVASGWDGIAGCACTFVGSRPFVVVAVAFDIDIAAQPASADLLAPGLQLPFAFAAAVAVDVLWLAERACCSDLLWRLPCRARAVQRCQACQAMVAVRASNFAQDRREVCQSLLISAFAPVRTGCGRHSRD